jgi:hypothetical protein
VSLHSVISTVIQCQDWKVEQITFITGVDNVKMGSKSANNRKPIVSLTEVSVIPEEDRVFKGCIHDYTVVFILIYVDNTSIRSNCETLVKRFHLTCFSVSDILVMN